ncbi:hypothetical protein GCM10027566_09660 [Arachidicoccus ginsenosidivorans]
MGLNLENVAATTRQCFHFKGTNAITVADYTTGSNEYLLSDANKKISGIFTEFLKLTKHITATGKRYFLAVFPLLLIV